MALSKQKARWQVVVLAAALAFVPSCGDDGDGDGTGPDQEPTGEFASQAQAVLDVTSEYFSENEAVSSLDALSSLIGAVGFSVAPAVAVTRPGGSDPKSYLEALEAAGSSIPDELEGTVWVLEDSPLGYVQDMGQMGPAGGVRFIMYDIDLVTGTPSMPLEPIGHLDIVESAEDPNDHEYTVVIDDQPQFDLSVDATIGATLEMTATGSISNGTEPLDVSFFLLGAADQGTFDVNANVSLSNSQAEIDVTMQASGTLADPQITTGTAVFIPGTSFVIGFFSEWDGSSFDGSVTVGANTVAFISGSENDVTLEPTGEGGVEAEDLVGLELMFEGLDRMFDDSLGIVGLVFAVIGFSLL